jgi:hypothetical protein
MDSEIEKSSESVTRKLKRFWRMRNRQMIVWLPRFLVRKLVEVRRELDLCHAALNQMTDFQRSKIQTTQTQQLRLDATLVTAVMFFFGMETTAGKIGERELKEGNVVVKSKTQFEEVDEMNGLDDLVNDGELNRQLAYVIGYFISTISHDLDEYKAWGLPYLQICLETLSLEKEILLEQIQDTFYGSIGSGFLFAYDDSIDESWTYIHPIESYLNQMTLNLQKFDEYQVVSAILVTFAHAAQRCNYDARVKLLSQRILSMYCLPEEGYSLEQQGEDSMTFPTTLQPRDPRTVGLFQAWKIGIAATIGGALMFCVGGLTAPQIISSIIGMLGGTSTTSTLLLNMTQLLMTYGPSTLTSSLTTIGAGVSTWKMSHRVQSIQEFQFDSLQPPHLQHLSESMASIDLAEAMNLNPTKPPRTVYILVSGPYNQSTEERLIWGADNYTESIYSTDHFMHSTGPVDLEKSWEDLEPNVSILNQGWWRRVIDPHNDDHAYILHWERKELHRLYHTQQHFFVDKGITLATEELLKLASPVLSAAALPITLMERVAEIDCPWLVVMDRAKQAGKLLAQHILQNAQSSLQKSSMVTPISLIGYGMGARVIFHCLQDLAQMGVVSRGIIENVVLIGSPIGIHRGEWLAARSVVVNRLVNCYSTKDWLLALLYRYRSWEVGVAGLQPVHLLSDDRSQPHHTINSNTEIENIDIGPLVSSHSDYGANLERILERVFVKEDSPHFTIATTEEISSTF